MIVRAQKKQFDYTIIELASCRSEAFMGSSQRETTMRNSKETRTALDAFVGRKAEIDTMLDRLKSLSDEHFGYAPDDIDWGHVGTLSHYAETLKRITDAAFKEGEHAE
jgi:hypothetical protein